MHWLHLLISGALAVLLAAGGARAQSPGPFSGFYVGVEGGVVSYDTQITFDGVDDPAGRGGAGYGAFVGYRRARGRAVVGVEGLVNRATTPDPYTFDPTVVGFAELDVRRGVSGGLEVRAGYLVVRRALLYAGVGASISRQSVRVDGVPLARFAGGADDATFAALHVGAGLEVALHARLHVRLAVRSVPGRDLDAADFGAPPLDASLTRFDVEPSHRQYFAGLLTRW